MKICDEIRRMRTWQKRQRAYMVLRHGIGLAMDAGIASGGDAERVARSLLQEAAEWNDFDLTSFPPESARLTPNCQNGSPRLRPKGRLGPLTCFDTP